MTKKEQPNTVSSVQKKPDSLDDLRKSYDELYDHGWLGEHHNNKQQKLLLDSAEVGPGFHLDVACGMGYSLDFAVERGAYSVGIELSYAAIKRGKLENHMRLMVQGNGEMLPWANDTFDYVSCLGSLEHFVNPSKGASEISRVLKPEGTAAILLPNSHNLLAIYNVYKTGGILPEQQEFERFATRVEWESLLRNSGLNVIDVKKFNVGFARVFKQGRGLFWYLYNAVYRALGDFWIPVNLSYNLIFVCKKM